MAEASPQGLTPKASFRSEVLMRDARVRMNALQRSSDEAAVEAAEEAARRARWLERCSCCAPALSRALAWPARVRLRILRALAVLLALAGSTCAVTAAGYIFWDCYDPSTTGQGQDASCLGRSATSDALKLASSVLTGLLLLVLVLRSYTEFLELQRRRLLMAHERFLLSPVLPSLLLQLVVCGIHSPAYVYGNSVWQNRGFDIVYDYDSLLTLMQILRIYLAIELLADLAGFEAADARVIARFNSVKLDTIFAFRSILQVYPLQSVGVLFALSMVIEGYALHVFERPVCATRNAILSQWCGPQKMGLTDFSSFSVAIWNAVVTALTIGYGDVYAVTHQGRVVGALTGLNGTISIALIIASTQTRHTHPPARPPATDP